jgi:hypothetical protein
MQFQQKLLTLNQTGCPIWQVEVTVWLNKKAKLVQCVPPGRVRLGPFPFL